MSNWKTLQVSLRQHPATWLVTGVADFIGSHLLEELLRLGQTLKGLDNFATGSRANLAETRSLVGEQVWKRFHFVEGDITDPDAAAESIEGVELVLHQAALGSVPRSIQEPISTHRANVDWFLQVLIAARDAGVRRLVYASSSSVYGDHPRLPKVEEPIGRPWECLHRG